MNSFNDEGYAPLHLARNEEVARALVNLDADVDLRVDDETHDKDDHQPLRESTPLHLARDAGVVRILIESGADKEAKDWWNRTPLHCARTAGVVGALIAGKVDTEVEDRRGKTPLECAKDVEVARALLDGGADIEHWREERDTCYAYGTPLVNSADNEDISLLLIERGASVNVSYVNEGVGEVSAVWKHVKANNVRVVREMLRKNAVVDSGDLLEATRKSSDEMLRLLVENDDDVNVKNKVGSTVLHSAGSHVKLLLDSGADVRARDKFGNTPLHTNVFGEVASLLIEKGADIEAANHEGETPLHYVCETVSFGGIGMYQRWDKLVALVKAGASIKAKRKDGKTPADLLQISSDQLLSFLRR